MGLLEKGMNYYKYSINKTFYRSTSTLKKVFSNVGFTVKQGSYCIPEIHEEIKFSFWRKFKNYLKIKFHIEEIYLVNQTEI